MININDFSIAKIHTIVVHGGLFHADDIFATAFLMLVAEKEGINLKIERLFKIPPSYTYENGYVVADIGGGRWDHHEPIDLKECRANGIHYASFGKIARDFHKGFISEDVYKELDKVFVAPMDYTDNNGGVNTLFMAIASFNKKWDEEGDGTPQFLMAVQIAKILLCEKIASIQSKIKAKKIGESAKSENGVVYLDKYAPINDYVDNDVIFVGSPSTRGDYQIVSVKRNRKRAYFIPKYRGVVCQKGDENGMTFCHSSGFMAAFVDKDAAKKFMQKVVEKTEYEIL